jgi:hypothetical protein
MLGCAANSTGGFLIVASVSGVTARTKRQPVRSLPQAVLNVISKLQATCGLEHRDRFGDVSRLSPLNLRDDLSRVTVPLNGFTPLLPATAIQTQSINLGVLWAPRCTSDFRSTQRPARYLSCLLSNSEHGSLSVSMLDEICCPRSHWKRVQYHLRS